MVLAVLSEIDAPRIQQLRIARGSRRRNWRTRSICRRRPCPGCSAATRHLPLNSSVRWPPCSAATKLLGRPVTEHLYTRPWLRAYADAPKKTVDQIVNDTLLAVEAFEALNLRRIPERVPTFAGDPLDDDAIDEFAADVRAAAEVNAPHVPNVTERLSAWAALSCLWQANSASIWECRCTWTAHRWYASHGRPRTYRETVSGSPQPTSWATCRCTRRARHRIPRPRRRILSGRHIDSPAHSYCRPNRSSATSKRWAAASR